MRIKALTIKQPWAWAIASGYKLIENRTWRTPYRGFLAIHAGKSWDESGKPVFNRILSGLSLELPDDMPPGLSTGAVIAVAWLDGICNGSTGSRYVRCGCGPWAAGGQFHWRLKDLRSLAEPFRCSGAQGLWLVDLPDDLIGASA